MSDFENKLINEIEKLERKIDSMTKLLSGNGEKGFCERVRLLEKEVNIINKNFDELKLIPKNTLEKIVLLGRAISALGIISGFLYLIFFRR